jgi:small subunit ribosomal protein S2
MEALPSAVFVLDTKKESIAVTEANKLGIPVVAVVDTNCDPDVIQYVIPGNDDAIRSGSLLCRVIADAVDEGRLMANKRANRPVPQRTDDEEARVAAAQAEARRQALAEAQHRDARIAESRAPGGAATATATAEKPEPAADAQTATVPPTPENAPEES